MRLIDADALIEELHHMIEGDADLRKDYEYMGIDDCIRSIPTAYNVDAIVAEIRRSSGNGYRDIDGDYVPPMIETKDAIDIVRKGGVE